MSQDITSTSSTEYRTCPWPVKLSAWIYVVTAGLWLVSAIINVIYRLPGSELEIFGHTFRSDLMTSRLAILVFSSVFGVAVIFIAVSLLRGRMWAYYICTSIWVCGTASLVWKYVHSNYRGVSVNLAADLVLTIAMIASFRSYRKMIAYRRQTAAGTIPEQGMHTP